MNRPHPSRRPQRGVTLIELMVALVIGLFVALAAVAALTVSRLGFTTVDASSQLRENARFTAELIQRIAVQAAYADPSKVDDRPQVVWPGVAYHPEDDPRIGGILGFDNAWVGPTNGTDPTTVGNDSRASGCTGYAANDTSCNNSSDVLIINFQGSSVAGNDALADGGMINCAGISEPIGAVGARAYAAFHLIRTQDGEPSLACTYKDPTTGAWTTQTLVKGVEAFQVLYGTDNVVANAAPPASSNGQHGAVDSYFTARQMTGPTPANTADNWRRVRSLRIGLMFRGDVGSRSPRPTAQETIDIMGMTSPPFQASISPPDPGGEALTVQSQVDGRMRQVMVFTVHLRNQQGYDLGCSATYPC